MRLSVLPIDSVHPHEKTLPQSVKALVRAILNERVQKDPIIVDRSTLVILDGMHRLSALKEVRASQILVCEVEYSDPRVVLSRWLRQVDTSEIGAVRLATELGFEEDSNPHHIAEGVDSGRMDGAIIFGNKVWRSQGRRSDTYPSEIVAAFDSYCAEHQLNIQLVEDEAFDPKKAPAKATLYVPRPTKEQVRIAGRSGRLLPSKSTRHKLPARPLGLDFPLELLLSKDTKAVGGHLEKLLRIRKVRTLPEGSVLYGRSYPEKVYLFE
jgi:hypothetical protein